MNNHEPDEPHIQDFSTSSNQKNINIQEIMSSFKNSQIIKKHQTDKSQNLEFAGEGSILFDNSNHK